MSGRLDSARAALGRNDECLFNSRLGADRLTFGNRPDRSTGICELFDPDRGGFELRRAGLWIYGIDGQLIRRNLIGKMNRHESQTGSNPGSNRTGATTEPRLELIRTFSPGSTPYFSPSSGESSSASPKRSGDE